MPPIDPPESPEPKSRRTRARVRVQAPRRWTSAVVLGALILGGLALRDPERETAASRTPPVEAVALPPPDLSSSAWFCPGGVPGDSTRITDTTEDDEEPTPVEDVVFVTNTSDRDSSVRVTALSADAEPFAQRHPVEAGTSIAIPVSELSDRPDAAMIIEPFSDGILVEERVGAPGRDDIAIGPCATETSATWYFAAGSTVKNSSQWLTLLNPYSGDAVVDITLVTNDEVRKPSALQALVVGARSRRSLFINDAADRKKIVALIIEAKDGRRIVAQQTIAHRNVSGRSGVSSTLGAVAPSTRFTFTSGMRSSGITRVLYIMNPAPVPTDVDVQFAAEGTTPMTLTIGAESVQAVNINELVPKNAPYAIIVQAAADFGGANGRRSERGIVVEDFEGFRIETRAQSLFGVSGVIGAVRPSTEWRFGRNRLARESVGQLSIYNPNESTATVDIAFVANGELVRPDSVQGVEVPGASPVVVAIDGLVDANVGLIVTSDQALYVERLLAGGEATTRAAGVPNRN